MKCKEAIVLAGGLGTRLQSVLKDIPKPMAPIGDKSFLHFLLSYLQHHGIEHVVLSVGYRWEVIKNAVGDSFGNMRISYAVEETPLGTGGGLKMAMTKIEGAHAFILNGDTFFEVPLRDLCEFYFAHNSDMAMTVKRKRDFFRYGTVDLDVCRVIGFTEKRPVKTGLINGGVYITRKTIFDDFNMPEKFSFETDFLEKHLEALKICAMRCGEYFIDIGVPADYEKAGRELPGKVFI